jgi:adenylosuccinate synthase
LNGFQTGRKDLENFNNDLTIRSLRASIPHNGGHRNKEKEVNCVADYKKMYDSLFNDVTDAISLLQRAQQKTEELFISGDDGVVLELKRDSESDDKDK